MERNELKPCPFCGRTNQRFLIDMDIYSYPQNRGRRAIICDCGLRLYARDNIEAEKKWQNRIYDKYMEEFAEKIIILVEFDKQVKILTEENEQLRVKNKSLLDQIAKEMLEENK